MSKKQFDCVYVLCVESSGGGSGTVVGVVCGVAVAAVAAIAGYFTHLKKKLCFKAQTGL